MKRKNINGLTDKEQRFADLYLIEANGTKAYQKAGFTAKSNVALRKGASTLLTKSNIQAYLNRQKQSAAEKLGITAERILAELNAIGMSRITDYGTFNGGGFEMFASDQIDPGKIGAIQSIETTVTAIHGDKIEGGGVEKQILRTTTKFKLWDKLEALVKLGEHVELFKSGLAPISGFHITVEHIGGKPRTTKK